MSMYIQQAARNKLVGIGLLLVFLGALFFGMVHISGGTDVQGGIAGCPFSFGGHTVCPMDFSEHVASWESLSLAVPTVLLFVLLISLLRALRISCRSLFANLFKQLCGIWEISTPLGIKRKAYIPIPNYLEEALSSGILHPKLF